MTLVLDYEVHDLGDVTIFVEGSVYIIDRNGSGEALGAQIVQPNIVNVNGFSCGPQFGEGDYQQWGIAAYSMDL